MVRVKEEQKREEQPKLKIVAKGSLPTMEPEQVLAGVRNKILSEMDEIIDKIIEKAKDGGCAEAKFLFQFAGVKEIDLAAIKEQHVDGAALAERYLQELLSQTATIQQPVAAEMNL